MKNSIQLKSRIDEYNYLNKLTKADGSESYTYLLKTSSLIIRTGYIDTKKRYIDPTGGPLIVEGSYLEEANAIVKSIDFVMEKGYTITFEPTFELEKELINAIIEL